VKISQTPQGTPEWLVERAGVFTASGLDTWVLKPRKITLTVEELKAELDALGVPRKGLTKRDELIVALPNPERYMKLCDGAKTAINKAIKEQLVQMLRSQDPSTLTLEEGILLDRETELDAQFEKQIERDVAVQYGNQLEPYARLKYQEIKGFEVTQVGLVTHDSGGFGCSPDGLIYQSLTQPPWLEIHGLEIKCPIYTTYLRWLSDTDGNGGWNLPEEHKLQVHASMAVTGLDRWDFIGYCPSQTPILITVHRDEFTERVLAGLKIMVEEKRKMLRFIASLHKTFDAPSGVIESSPVACMPAEAPLTIELVDGAEASGEDLTSQSPTGATN